MFFTDREQRILDSVFNDDEKKEYLKLYKKIFKPKPYIRTPICVKMDFSNPDHVRFKEFNTKIETFFGW